MQQISLITDILLSPVLSGDLHEFGRAAARLMPERLGYPLVGYAEIDWDSGETLITACLRGEDESVNHKFDCTIEELGIIRLSAQSGRLYLSGDVPADPLFAAHGLLDTRSELAAPVMLDGKVVGVINVESDVKDAFDQSDSDAVNAVALAIGHAMSNVRLISRVKKMKKRLEEKEAELDRLSYTLAHDMRAPIISVQGYSGLLRERVGDEADETTYYLDRIDANAERMIALITGLTELARIDRDQAAPTPTDMRRALNETLETLHPEIEKLKAAVKVEGDLPDALGNPLFARQIWQNLLGNALQHARNGVPPEISVSAAGGDQTVSYTVADNGRGIPTERQGSIFALFTRVGRKDDNGTGLGLAIVKRIVDRLGGRIEVESEPGRGARFTFTLPRA